jgi:hypothetical protein
MVVRSVTPRPVQTVTRTVAALYALAILATRGLWPELANVPVQLCTPGCDAAFIGAEQREHGESLALWKLMRTPGYPLLVTIARSTLH